MIKVIFAFLIIFCLFFLGIRVFREMSGLEKWNVAKYAGYSMICAVFTIMILVSIVLIF